MTGASTPEGVDASRHLYYASHLLKDRRAFFSRDGTRRKRFLSPSLSPRLQTLVRETRSDVWLSRKNPRALFLANLIRATIRNSCLSDVRDNEPPHRVSRVPRPCGTATSPRLRCTTAPRTDAAATPCASCAGCRTRDAGTNPRATVRGNVNTSIVVVPTTRRDARRVIILG